MKGEITRASYGDCLTSTPPPAEMVFVMPPLPTFPSLHEFVCGGSTLSKLLRADSSGGGASAGSAGKLRGREVVVAPKFKSRESNICFQFRKSDTCTYSNKCRFSHDIRENLHLSTYIHVSDKLHLPPYIHISDLRN